MSNMSINTNSDAFVALESLSANNADLSKMEDEISTGKRVNSSADNPAAYGIAQEIGGDLSGQQALNDGLSYASNIVGTANSGANQIMGVLKELKGSIVTAADHQNEPKAAEQLNKQITGYLNQINTIARQSTSDGINLLEGDKGKSFGVNNTGYSYVTSVAGNTASVDNAFSMLGKKDATSLTDALGLGGTAATDGNADVTDNFLSKALTGSGGGSLGSLTGAAVNTALKTITSAISNFSDVTSDLGVNAETIKNSMQYGKTLADNMKNEQGSLVDADMSEASAELQQDQVRQQLAIKSLTIANGNSQSLLALFQG